MKMKNIIFGEFRALAPLIDRCHDAPESYPGLFETKTINHVPHFIVLIMILIIMIIITLFLLIAIAMEIIELI